MESATQMRRHFVSIRPCGFVMNNSGARYIVSGAMMRRVVRALTV